MIHVLRYHARALKRLQGIHPHDQKKVLAKLQLLSDNPLDTQLDIRKMANTSSSYRIRVGDIRIIYEIDAKHLKVYIMEIDYRGNVY